MENESGEKRNLSSEKKLASIQNVAEIGVFICWLVATTLLILLGSAVCRKIFNITSISLLGVSLFNMMTMIGLSATKQGRFSIPRLILRIALAALAVIGLAFSLFALGLKIQ